jgi:hypothetical protein
MRTATAFSFTGNNEFPVGTAVIVGTHVGFKVTVSKRNRNYSLQIKINDFPGK